MRLITAIDGGSRTISVQRTVIRRSGINRLGNGDNGNGAINPPFNVIGRQVTTARTMFARGGPQLRNFRYRQRRSTRRSRVTRSTRQRNNEQQIDDRQQ